MSAPGLCSESRAHLPGKAAETARDHDSLLSQKDSCDPRPPNGNVSVRNPRVYLRVSKPPLYLPFALSKFGNKSRISIAHERGHRLSVTLKLGIVLAELICMRNGPIPACTCLKIGVTIRPNPLNRRCYEIPAPALASIFVLSLIREQFRHFRITSHFTTASACSDNQAP